MTATSSGQAAQYRLAQHYLNKLRQANTAVIRSRVSRNHWLNVMDQDWGQIRHCQQWTASWKENEAERARLCSAFIAAGNNILGLRQTPSERLAWLQQALAAARKVGDREAERTHLYFVGQAYFIMGATDEAERHAHLLLDLSTNAHDEVSIGRAWYTLGSAALQRSSFNEAENYLLKSLGIFESCGMEAELGRTLQGLGRVANFRGDYPRAVDYFAQYLAIVEASGREGELGVALLTFSNGLLSNGDVQAAYNYAERAVNVCRSLNYVRMLPAALVSLADCEVKQCDFENARLHYKEGNDIARSIGAISTVIHGLHGLGNVSSGEGDNNGAFIYWNEALELAMERRAHFYTFEILHDMAANHFLNYQIEAARPEFEQMLALAPELDTEYHWSKTLSAAAMMLHCLDQHEKAARWVGVLTKYSRHTIPELFSALCERLEAELDRNRYESALKHGQALTLADAIIAIRSERY